MNPTDAYAEISELYFYTIIFIPPSPQKTYYHEKKRNIYIKMQWGKNEAIRFNKTWTLVHILILPCRAVPPKGSFHVELWSSLKGKQCCQPLSLLELCNMCSDERMLERKNKSPVTLFQLFLLPHDPCYFVASWVRRPSSPPSCLSIQSLLLVWKDEFRGAKRFSLISFLSLPSTVFFPVHSQP